MKLTQGLAALVLLGSVAAANAEVTGTVTVVSDYNWRGVTQSAQNPALQGSIDYAHESGFYAGVWGSNVDEGLDYPEVYAGLGYKWLEGKVWYSSDFANYDEQAWYFEGNAAYELPANFGLEAHVGYSTGDGIEAAYGVDNYMDWSVGVTYALGHFDLGLKYADGSDLKTLDGTPGDVSSSEGVAIFSVATSFPWSSE